MAILKPKVELKNVVIRVRISSKIMEEAEQYKTWAGFKKIDNFIEQAIEFVLQSDKEWKTEHKMQPDSNGKGNKNSKKNVRDKSDRK
jgi:hypothetical protein